MTISRFNEKREPDCSTNLACMCQFVLGMSGRLEVGLITSTMGTEETTVGP